VHHITTYVYFNWQTFCVIFVYVCRAGWLDDGYPVLYISRACLCWALQIFLSFLVCMCRQGRLLQAWLHVTLVGPPCLSLFVFVPALAEAVVQPKLLPVLTRSCNSDLLLLLLANTRGASARVPRGAPALEPGCGKVCTDKDNSLVRHSHAHDWSYRYM
jgi:hypothetical protein